MRPDYQSSPGSRASNRGSVGASGSNCVRARRWEFHESGPPLECILSGGSSIASTRLASHFGPGCSFVPKALKNLTHVETPYVFSVMSVSFSSSSSSFARPFFWMVGTKRTSRLLRSPFVPLPS
jgi:hypothetical protein